jgi:DNA-binding response OmpR family regulator
MSGDALIDEIRDRNLNCRIAVVSGVEPDEDVFELGFDDYLTKPISQPELRSTIERLLKQAQYEEKISQYFSLARRKAILESSDLQNENVDNEYTELLGEIEELRDELTQTVNEFDENNFRIACRDIAQS